MERGEGDDTFFCAGGGQPLLRERFGGYYCLTDFFLFWWGELLSFVTTNAGLQKERTLLRIVLDAPPITPSRSRPLQGTVPRSAHVCLHGPRGHTMVCTQLRGMCEGISKKRANREENSFVRRE